MNTDEKQEGGQLKRTIGETFMELKKARRIGVVPFVPAGYPDLSVTGAAIVACDRAGAAVIEVGFPFSDPIADGPVIQEAFTAALAKKLTVDEVFGAIAGVRGKVGTPMVAMVSYSIVFRYGVERFLGKAGEVGFAGVIIPDLPPPEAEKVCGMVRGAGLETILLIAPTTPKERRGEIVKLCSGFVYYLSVSGITGERDRLPEGVGEAVKEIKGMTELPVCVGFGISKPGQVKELGRFADGAIVGSAIVRRMKESGDQSAAGIGKVVGEYVKGLVGVE